MKVRIEIDTKTFVRFWLVILGFVLVALLLYGAREAIILIASAFFLAIALSKPVNWLSQKIPGKSRGAATGVAFVAIVALLALVVTLVVPPIIDQSAKLVGRVPQIVEDMQRQSHMFDDLIQKYNLQPQIDDAVNSARDNMASLAGDLGRNIVGSIGTLITVLTKLLIMLFLAYFMLVEGPNWKRRLWLFYKDKEKMIYHQTLLDRMYNVVTSYVVGQVTVSGIGALSAGFFVFALGFVFPELTLINLPMPIIAITFILSLIPMFGATIAGVLAAVLIGLNSFPAAVIYIVYFFIYQQVENNVISPAVQSKTVKLSALAILASVTIGTFSLGIIGGIISIPIAGCIKILMSEHLRKVKAEREKRELELARLAKKRKEQREEQLKASK